MHDLAAGQILEGNHNRLLLLRCHRYSEQELIPNIRELPDPDDDKAGDRQRYYDMAIDAEEAGTIDLRRLQHLGWNRHIEIPEHERTDRQAVDDVDEDQPGNRIIQMDVLHKLNERDQNALVRDEHAE